MQQQVISQHMGSKAMHAKGPQEGVCTVCKAAVSAHVNKDGRWVGCRKGARTEGLSLRLILTPDRRFHTRDGHGNGHNPSTSQTAQPRVTAAPRSQVAYVALFPLSHAKVKEIDSDRDRGVYRLVASHKSGFTRAELLEALGTAARDGGGKVRTGVVDGALYRLKNRGLIGKIDIEK